MPWDSVDPWRDEDGPRYDESYGATEAPLKKSARISGESHLADRPQPGSHRDRAGRAS